MQNLELNLDMFCKLDDSVTSEAPPAPPRSMDVDVAKVIVEPFLSLSH